MSRMDNIICIDAGNSRVKLGLFSSRKLLNDVSISTIKAINDPAALTASILSCIKDWSVDQASICTVVPSVLSSLQDSLRDAGIGQISEFNLDKDFPFSIDYNDPSKLGRDRIAAVLGARRRRSESKNRERAILVVDAGSALTLEYLDSQNRYRGGIITAGPNLVKRSLSLNTEQLPLVDISELPNLIGTNTESCIQSGILYGFVEQVRGLINRIDDLERNRGNRRCKLFLTGGWSEILAKELGKENRHFPYLVLEGIDAFARL